MTQPQTSLQQKSPPPKRTGRMTPQQRLEHLQQQRQQLQQAIPGNRSKDQGD